MLFKGTFYVEDSGTIGNGFVNRGINIHNLGNFSIYTGNLGKKMKFLGNFLIFF